jgi:hypothetical protein
MTQGRGGSDGPRTYIALLRGINVGGGNRVPMAELRSLCGDLGWRGVRIARAAAEP